MKDSVCAIIEQFLYQNISRCTKDESGMKADAGDTLAYEKLSAN